ncbi:MAG: hypothetical protein Q7V63_09020 [Gammaproteobacteria bacterium]|nr:hypothetical protein [Gammaproteobacteria bacterium]
MFNFLRNLVKAMSKAKPKVKSNFMPATMTPVQPIVSDYGSEPFGLDSTQVLIEIIPSIKDFKEDLDILASAIQSIDKHGESFVMDIIDSFRVNYSDIIASKNLQHTASNWQDIAINWAIKLDSAHLANSLYDYYSDISESDIDIKEARDKLKSIFNYAANENAYHVCKFITKRLKRQGQSHAIEP